MGAEQLEDRLYTEEEYFQLCLQSDWKYEYYNGRIVAMADGSPPHNRAKRNFYDALRAGKPASCLVYDSDTAVQVSDLSRYYFPDVSALCGQEELVDSSGIEVLVNPQLIVEVLSKSTGNTDRGDKMEAYRLIPSLREYILVDSQGPFVQTFYRAGEKSWKIGNYFRMDQSVYVTTFDISIPMATVYERITFN